MEPLTSFIETAGIAVVGILIRFLIALAGLALLSLCLATIFLGVAGVRRLFDRARGIVREGSLVWHDGLFAAPGHTWLAETAGDALRVGLDDLAQKLLPGARVLQFAPVGSRLRKGDMLATLQVGQHRLAVASPTAGQVVSVNERVHHEPEWLHRDPYRRGWLAALRPDTTEFQRFHRGERARAWIREEDHRLNAFLEMELGIAAADGGEWIVSPTTMLSEGQFAALTREFLTPQ